MNIFWVIILIIGALAFTCAFWALAEELFQGKGRCFAIASLLVVIAVFSFIGAGHKEIVSNEVTDLTVSHTDIIAGKGHTTYQLLLVTDEGNVLKHKVGYEEYATIHEGDRFSGEVTYYKNNLGEEFTVVNLIKD